MKLFWSIYTSYSIYLTRQASLVFLFYFAISCILLGYSPHSLYLGSKYRVQSDCSTFDRMLVD